MLTGVLWGYILQQLVEIAQHGFGQLTELPPSEYMRVTQATLM